MADFIKQGWIKIYRKSLDSAVWKNPMIWFVWSWCLLKASHDDIEFPFNNIDIVVKRGSFITGLLSAKKELPTLSVQNIRTAFKYLKSTGRLTVTSSSKFSVITIVKWEEYQDTNKQTNKPLTNKQQTTNKPLTTYKNVRIKELKKYNTKEDMENLKKKIQGNIKTKDINDVYRVVEAFKPVNKFWHTLEDNPKQMDAAYRMIQVAGFDQVMKVIAILPQTNKIPYLANIFSPVKLEEKWSDLEAQLIKKKSIDSVKNKKAKVAFT